MSDEVKVLVIGASGQIGRRVCRGLLERGADVRGMTHSEAGATRLEQVGVRDIVHGDLSDTSTLPPCVAGVDRVMLITRALHDPAQEIRAVDAALAGGVRRIVKLSSEVLYYAWDDLDDDGRATPNMVAALHGPAEDAIRATGVEHVSLRSTWFMGIDTNPLVAPGLRAGWFVWPDGFAGLALVHPDDVSDVAVHCLLADGVPGPVLRLTGPAELSVEDIARGLSTMRGTTIAARSLSTDDYAAWMESDAGMPGRAADIVAPYATRRTATVSDAIERLLERPARTFEHYIAEERIRAQAR